MNRSTSVVRQEDRVLVRLYEDDVLIKTVDVSDHSLRYAEDTAENWEQGILNA